jgi:integrating conjugative element protein (TIGR03752 family)
VYLMSAIIAEVPVSNKLLEPAFPFKAIIGKHDLMAANGAHLPSDIAGAVVSGYSVGNMTMSCARSYVMQILFVFADGNSYTVYPEKINREASDLYPHDALGYMSDPYGNTCIAGKYITNAPKVLATYAALGGISATGQALAQAQLSTLSNSFETTQNLTGNVGKYAAGEFLNGASQKSLEWYSQRVSGSFDAVYIPASFKDKQGAYHVTHLTLNLSQTIPIDLNQKARKMINENSKDHSRSVTLD